MAVCHRVNVIRKLGNVFLLRLLVHTQLHNFRLLLLKRAGPPDILATGGQEFRELPSAPAVFSLRGDGELRRLLWPRGAGRECLEMRESFPGRVCHGGAFERERSTDPN